MTRHRCARYENRVFHRVRREEKRHREPPRRRPRRFAQSATTVSRWFSANSVLKSSLLRTRRCWPVRSIALPGTVSLKQMCSATKDRLAVALSNALYFMPKITGSGSSPLFVMAVTRPVGFLRRRACRAAAARTPVLGWGGVNRDCGAGAVSAPSLPPPRKARGRGYHYLNVAGEENGLVASTTNMTSAFRSLVPLLETSITVPGSCPGIAWPAPTDITPCGVFWLNSPVNT